MAARPLVAIIAAYNEEDIIGAAVRHLVNEGAFIYLLDDGSTDRTVAAAREAAGDRLVGLEELPPVVSEGGQRVYAWSRILDRKAEIARTLDAAWLIHHDADEFRESPWPHLSLVEAVALVDRLGWNAIDFDVLDFDPPQDGYRAGDDPAASFSRYRPAAGHDKVQVRCWKNTGALVDLSSSGGHDARFPGRRVFPIRFPMRHYPIRGAEHARRKVFEERVPYFDPGERARGWHVQYDRLMPGQETNGAGRPLIEYDPDAIRVSAQVANRLVEAAAEAVPLEKENLAESTANLEDSFLAQKRLAARAKALEDELAAQRHENERLWELSGQLQVERDEARNHQSETAEYVETLLAQVRADGLERDRLVRDAADLVTRLSDLNASMSWRLTAPLRAVWRALGGR